MGDRGPSGDDGPNTITFHHNRQREFEVIRDATQAAPSSPVADASSGPAGPAARLGRRPGRLRDAAVVGRSRLDRAPPVAGLDPATPDLVVHLGGRLWFPS